MTHDTMPSAHVILAEELKLAGFHNLTEPRAICDAMEACIERTYKQVRSACWGNRMRTIACDVLFREAQQSAAALRAALEGVTVNLPAPENCGARKADWLQPVLLLAGAALGLLGSVRSFNVISILLGVGAALCILAALLRELQRAFADGAGIKLARIIARRLKLSKLLAFAEKHAAAQHASPAEAAQPSLALDAAALGTSLLQQMDVIDENLGLFRDEAQPADQSGALLPLMRAILQERCADPQSIPEPIAVELEQYMRANGLRAVEYDAAHASLFQTQPMDETFTIFPAILDGKGNIIEHGIAGVQEE